MQGCQNIMYKLIKIPFGIMEATMDNAATAFGNEIQGEH